MGAGKEFVGLLPPKDQQPPADYNNAPAGFHNMVRNQLTITTWLCLGGIAQGILFLAVGRLALAPAVLVVAYKALLTYAQVVGWVRNPLMDDVIMKKFSAQIPDASGHYGSKPADNDIVVFLIGARSHHPLGIFGPGFKELGDYFDSMAKNLDKHSEEFGFLGMTAWANTGDSKTCPEILSVGYFRNVEGLHKFAHSEHHMGGWNWWNKDIAKMPHTSIYHEIYHAPPGNWESIYVNSRATGVNSIKSRFTDEETGQTKWASPIVDASRGLLKTSAGRMSRSQADVHEKLGISDPY
ncbi:hypothetical protein LTR17_025850 [Elasticomyces elasticus]|nr:hypothetical protein LTR17_025850 [Elasticomyces elasticus]